jgi:hypothetical protein
MKSVAVPLVAAVVLALAGGAFWVVGHTETRIADMHARLATLHYDEAEREGEAVEQSLGLERRVPMVGRVAETDVRDTRASAGYWRSDYAAVAPRRDANGVVTETDPAILFLSANAGFRASQAATDRGDVVRRLDNVVKSYGEVLKAEAGACTTDLEACETRAMDAAYNYEFTIRAREAMMRGRPTAAGKNAAARAALKVGDEEVDLPSGPTLHGRPGGPPPATAMNQFKIVIPKRGEERKDAPDAGKGGQKIRKG